MYIYLLTLKTNLHFMNIKIKLILIIAVAFSFTAVAQNHNSPKLSDPNSFSIVLLSDPQNYTKFDTNQPIFDLMTAWTASQIDNLNIKAVLCTGDLVEQNNWLTPDGINGNQTSTQQWKSVSRAFERLDDKVPYIISLGNHDYGYKSAENRDSQFQEYFPVERNSTWKNHLVSIYPNQSGNPSLENAAFEFDLPDWGRMLIITSEFAPRDEVLTWAKELVSSDKYKNHRVIFLTHSYLRTDGDRIKSENYKVTPSNYGEAIWDKLIYPNSNIEMVICGHYALIGGYEMNVGQRSDKNSSGKNVYQMMFNSQTLGGGWHGNGGDGWLRMLEFMPDGKTIKVKTYSPLFGYSTLTSDKSNRTESFDEFEVILGE